MHQAPDTDPATVKEIVQHLHSVIVPYPSIKHERLPGVAWTVAARMPNWHALDPGLLTARLVLWIFALDDLCDDPAYPAPLLYRRIRQYRDIARVVPATPDDDLALLLVDIYGEVRQRPGRQILKSYWNAAFEGLLNAMLAERESLRPASFDVYLNRGMASIGTILDGWTVLLLLGDVPEPEQLTAVQYALEAGARVARLANDLNSAAKEEYEQKQNALTLLGSRARVADVLEATYAEWQSRIQQVRTPSGTFEQCMKMTIDSIISFYRRWEYHRFPQPSGSL